MQLKQTCYLFLKYHSIENGKGVPSCIAVGLFAGTNYFVLILPQWYYKQRHQSIQEALLFLHISHTRGNSSTPGFS